MARDEAERQHVDALEAQGQGKRRALANHCGPETINLCADRPDGVAPDASARDDARQGERDEARVSPAATIVRSV
ncbi:MAG: hypothetical protein ACRDLY_10765 [Thermoleophilaceae bacterium]